MSVIYKTFFVSTWEDSITISSLTDVSITITRYSASLTIVHKDPAKEYKLGGFKKDAALKAKEIIDGMLLLKDKSIKMPKKIPLKEKKRGLQNLVKKKFLIKK